MGIGSKLKQIHADHIGKTTALLLALVFGVLTMLIYDTIKGIVDAGAGAQRSEATASNSTPPGSPVAGSTQEQRASYLPASVSSPASR